MPFLHDRIDSLPYRVGRSVGRWWRRATFQWWNLLFGRLDFWFAAVLFAAFFVIDAIDANVGADTKPPDWLAFIALLLLLLLLIGFCRIAGIPWLYAGYLKADAAYEDLRTSHRPSLKSCFQIFLRFPCTAVVLFAIALGLSLAAFGYGGSAPAIRSSLLQATTPIPPFESFLRLVTGKQPDADWPSWLKLALAAVYSGVIFALVKAWFERGNQRKNYAASLFTDKDRKDSPYGFKSEGAAFDWRNEPHEQVPHEQVLLNKGERIANACLPYLQVDLSGPEWAPPEVKPDLCRGVVAVLERIFRSNTNSERCWRLEPARSNWIADWLLAHFKHLLQIDGSASDSPFSHRLGEAAKAVAVVLASCPSKSARPTPTSRGAFHDPDRESKFLTHLRDLFGRAPKRPVLLLAACDAAERLGKPEYLLLLDEQTRNLDVQAGFTISQTDLILQTRDRVLRREPDHSDLLGRLLRRIEDLKLELVVPETEPKRFRRPSDGREMVLIVGGSFWRGDDRDEATSPKRRVHVGSYLIDVEPVAQESFTNWVQKQGSVLRMDRGFFPVQGSPHEASPYDYASHVTWFAATAYARWAIPSAGDLPTEAQWEKAVRGTADNRRYPSGDTWEENPVSPFGVRACHMLEWTRDAYANLAYRDNPSVFDPINEGAASAGDEVTRVVRGRSPETPVAGYSLFDRLAMEPVTGGFAAPIGFRVAVALEMEKQ